MEEIQEKVIPNLRKITTILLVLSAVLFAWSFVGFVVDFVENIFLMQGIGLSIPQGIFQLLFFTERVISFPLHIFSFLLLWFLFSARKKLKAGTLPSKWGYYFYCLNILLEIFLSILGLFFILKTISSHDSLLSERLKPDYFWDIGFGIIVDVFRFVLGIFSIIYWKKVKKAERPVDSLNE